MKYWIALIVFFHVNHSVGQEQYALPVTYSNTIQSKDLKKHVFTLASDDFEGRETGTKGQKKAASYISQYYESLGLEPIKNYGWYQTYPLKKETNLGSIAIMNEKKFSFLDDFYFFGLDAQELKTNNLVFVGHGISTKVIDDYKKVKELPTGSWVMCLQGEPIDKNGKSLITGSNETSEWNDDVSLKAAEVKKRGGSALLVVNTNYDMYMKRIRYWLEQPRMQLEREDKKEDSEYIPIIYISPAFANELLRASGQSIENLSAKAKQGKKTKPQFIRAELAFHVEQKVERIEAENVLAFIEGGDPVLKEEVVVVSAHYDHVGIINGQIHNGADDDASGTAAALEIGEAFIKAKQEGRGAKRSVLVLHVSGEEKGLLGSEWYSDHPVFPLSQTVCDLNIDMIGRIDPEHKDSNYVYLIGSDKLSTDLHAISERCNDAYTNLSLDYTFNNPNDPNRFYYRSDHYNFAKHNIPVIFYFSGVHEDYHKPGDDAEKILYNKMETITRLVFHTAWDVANRSERLKVDVKSDFKN